MSAGAFVRSTVVGALALLGCTAGTAGGQAPTPGSGGSPALGGSVGSGGATSPAGSGGRVGTGGASLQGDASSGGADGGCSQLNIGILGNPGSNSSSNFQSWLEARGTSVQRFQTTDGEALTAGALQPFDVIVVDLPPRDYTTDEAAIFAAWVSAGGGVASMSGYHNDTSQDWRANSLLAPLGVAYSGQLLWGPVTQFASHPMTVGLTSVTFTGGYGISDLGVAGATRTPIAFLPGPITAGIAVTLGSGHAFVWGDEWIEFDSEWSSMPQIPQLWLQVFNWLSPPNRCMLTGIMIGEIVANSPAAGRLDHLRPQ